MSTPSSASASPTSTTTSTSTSTTPVVPSQAGAPAEPFDDLPPAVGDVIVDHDGSGIPVPFPDPDADGDDPDEVEPRDESTSGPNDRG